MSIRCSRRVGRIVGVALTAIALMSVGFGGSADAKPASGEPIKFGYIEMFPGASMQPTITQAIEAYFADWNKRGGYKGRPVDLLVETPEGYNVNGFVAAVNELSDAGVVAFLSPGICDFTLNVLRSKQIPSFGANDMCGFDDPSFFFSVTARAPTIPMLTYAVENGATNFAVAYPSAIPGLREGFVDPLEDYLAANPDVDVELVDVGMPFPASAADWDAAIATMKDADVDALFAAAQPDGGLLGLQEARLQGFGPEDGVQWIFGPNFYDPEIAANSAFEGTFANSLAIPWEDTSNPEIKKMTKVLKGKIDKQDGWAQSGYQTAATVEEAMKGLKGEPTPENLRKLWSTYHKRKLPLTPVKVDWTDVFKNPAGGVIVKVEDGVFVPVTDYLVIPAKDFNK